MDRPLRLRARFTREAVDSLRNATGDEELRKAIYSEFGTRLYEDFHKIRKEIEAWLVGDDDEEDGAEGEAKRPSIPEKRRKKLLDPATWARDRKLLEAARALWQVMGDEEFPDFNTFRRDFDAAAKEHGIRLTAAEKKLIQLRLGWRDLEAREVIKKTVRAKPEDIEAAAAGALHGHFLGKADGRDVVITYEAEEMLADWLKHLDEVELYGADDPLFPATSLKATATTGFRADGFERRPWKTTEPVRKIVNGAFTAANLAAFGPHAFRHMLARHAARNCKSVAELVATSQNLGHTDVLTTLRSYGQIDRDRMRELITGESRIDLIDD